MKAQILSGAFAALFSAALVTAQVLPRVGYAANVATWMCGSG